MPSAQKKSTKSVWKEFRIELVGKRRDNGSLFVTSPNLGPFSALLQDGKWEDVVPFVKRFLEVNFGRVREVRLIHDASELFNDDTLDLPPAYVIAELTSNARAATAGLR